jgi:hypothetical protein
MKINRYLLILIATLAFIFNAWRAHATEKSELQYTTYISETDRESLKNDFTNGGKVSNIDGNWTCDMYGMSSHIAVAKNIRRYSFSQKDSKIQNKGVQIVPVYEMKDGEVVGNTSVYRDRIRQNGPGQLISELSYGDQVIAYSRCHKS